MTRLEHGIEMLGYAGGLAHRCRDCFTDEEVRAAVARHVPGAQLESLYITSVGKGKKTRYNAIVSLEWERACITVTGQGSSIKAAVLAALEKRQGQYGLWQPEEPEDLPF
jgi:hypothetical protein